MPDSLSPSWIWGLYFGAFLTYLTRRSAIKNFKLIFRRQDPIVYTDEKTIKYMEENWWTQVKHELKVETLRFLARSVCMIITVSWDVIGGLGLYFTLLATCLFFGFLGTLVIPPTVLFNIFTINLVFIASPFFVVNFIEEVEQGTIKSYRDNM